MPGKNNKHGTTVPINTELQVNNHAILYHIVVVSALPTGKPLMGKNECSWCFQPFRGSLPTVPYLYTFK